MAMVRKTITLPEGVARDIEKLSGGNFSAYTVEALERAVRRHHLRTLLAEMEAEDGPLSRAEIDAARAELRGE